MSIPAYNDIIEPNDQTEARKASLEAIGKLVGNVYTNKFERSSVSGGEDTITALKHFDKLASVEAKMAEIKAGLGEGERPPADKKDALNEELKALGTVRIAGRLTTPTRGNFVHLTDGNTKLQVYSNKKGPLALVLNDGNDTLDEANGWAFWQLLDHGDFIGVEGYLFITNTGEVSVHAEKLQFLAKAMVPMPDKMHGIADPELQRRYRYADLIASTLQVEHEGLTTREVFERRAKLITGMRRFLDDAGFIEVETPMLTPKATGAAAKPFETHHNALDIPLYARIAPELYLKRLVVGGFEKVYELNRNFRNEGLSQKHNPEFTMLEFYAAYMDVNGMMDFCEKMLRESVVKATGGLQVEYESIIKTFDPPVSLDRQFKRVESEKIIEKIDFSEFSKISMNDSISTVFEEEFGFLEFEGEPYSKEWLEDYRKTDFVWTFAREIKLYSLPHKRFVTPEDKEKIVEVIKKAWSDSIFKVENERLRYEKLHSPARHAGLIEEVFGFIVEENLIQPTFIIDYPKSISPLSKASPDDANIAERFELFINGMEVANGFSELNDPLEQYERFADQMNERDGGDEEAMVLDEDYIRALAYGMPPAAGIGIGIDRLVMLLTNKHSIRDVILFPHMRPERKDAEKEASEG